MIFQVCEPLYTANYASTKKVNVNQGGTSSAKTYTILQVLFTYMLEQDGVIITVVGQDIPNLKKGAIRDAARIMASSPVLQKNVPNYRLNKGYNKTERVYEFNNGSIMEFTSYDSEQDAKSGKRDYLFINEANGIDFDIYFQLAIRTNRKVFIDYNPTARFWAHEQVIGKENAVLFISDHRHNKFLSDEKHAEIEAIREIDFELWKVYARGVTGQIQGLIYNHYKFIDHMPETFTSVLGLDFGFNHKTALIEVAHDTGKLFWDQLIYQTELTIGDLIQQMRELNISRTKRIYADHAAPDKIKDLQLAGFNVHKADKDVKNGIDFVKRNGLYITKRSSGVRAELLSYKWKEKDGIVLDEPVKFKDDALDAGRYGSYTGFRLNKGMKIADTSNVNESILDELE